MNVSQTRSKRRYVTILFAVIGVGALIALGTLSAASGGLDIKPGPRIFAGSGSAATNTTFAQPVVGAMNLGATATWTTPESVPATTVAVPPVKAGG
jgi:Kef-type K+ transport system membrane component KefB